MNKTKIKKNEMLLSAAFMSAEAAKEVVTAYDFIKNVPTRKADADDIKKMAARLTVLAKDFEKEARS